MFDYGNARLRAMKSALLSGTQLEALAEIRSLPLLLAGFSRTPYRKAAETATVRATGMGGIGLMLSMNLIETLSKLRTFYQDEALEQIMLLLRRYDVHNLTVILRGLEQRILRDEINLALMPVGDLKLSTLYELMRVMDPREAIDVLATLHLSIARPLLELRARRPGATVWEMELALQRWYFRMARNQSCVRGALADALDIEADTINLMTVLRFAHAPAERERLHDVSGIDSLSDLLVEPGRLKETQLLSSAAKSNVEDALAPYSEGYYAKPLAAGLRDYKETNRLSGIERALRHFRFRHLASYISRDPLGIGVPVGYITLKDNEASNIRAIAWGIHLGQPANSIRKSLEVVI